MPQQSLVLSYRQAVHKTVLEDGAGSQLVPVHASTNAAADLGDFQTSSRVYGSAISCQTVVSTLAADVLVIMTIKLYCPLADI